MSKVDRRIVCSDMVDVAQRLVQQTLYVIVIEAVHRPATASAAAHDAKVTQDAQVLRDGWLCQLNG